MPMSKKYFSNTPQIIYLASTLFLLGSLWYIGLHYSFFGINIYSYISFGDSVNMFINKLPLMILISCFSIFFFFGLQYIFENPLKKVFILPKDNKQIRRRKILTYTIVSVLITILPMLLSMLYLPKFKHEVWVIYLKAFFVLLNIYWYIHLAESVPKQLGINNILNQTSMYATIILTFFMVIYFHHKLGIWKISEEKYDNWKETKYILKLKDETIQVGDSSYLLGSTKDYLFLIYPQINDFYTRTRVIKMENIQEIIYLKKIPWYSILP